jgi:hypothetical protein
MGKIKAAGLDLEQQLQDIGLDALKGIMPKKKAPLQNLQNAVTYGMTENEILMFYAQCAAGAAVVVDGAGHQVAAGLEGLEVVPHALAADGAAQLGAHLENVEGAALGANAADDAPHFRA